ncbi:MAG: tetratricopeptide repeat protein [Glycocaulis sp.]
MSHLFLTARLILLAGALALAGLVSAKGDEIAGLVAGHVDAALEVRSEGRPVDAALMLSDLLEALLDADEALDPAILSDVLFHYAETLRLADRPDAAEAMARRALQIDTGRLPADSPALAAVYSVLGAALLDQGRGAEAEIELRAALPIYEAAFGDHAYTAATLYQLAQAADAQAHYPAAARLAARALVMLTRVPEADQPDGLSGQARFLAARSYGEWYDSARRASDWSGTRDAMLGRAALAGAGQDRAARRVELSEFLLARSLESQAAFEAGRFAEIEVLAAVAMEIWQAEQDLDPVYMSAAMAALALALSEQARPDEALAMQGRRFEFVTTAMQDRPVSVVHALSTYVTALTNNGQDAEARAVFARHAAALQGRLGGTDRAVLAMTEARLLSLDGDHASALRLAGGAQADLEAGGATAHDLQNFHSERSAVARRAGQYEDAYADLVRGRELADPAPGSFDAMYWDGSLAVIALYHLDRPGTALDRVRDASASLIGHASAQAEARGIADEGREVTSLRSLFILHTEAAWGAAHAREP